jgi:SNF2 family DNA or RNA helicase
VESARATFTSSKQAINALEKQPDFLAGGKLRDYQLEGINWLTYAWIKVRDVLV